MNDETLNGPVPYGASKNALSAILAAGAIQSRVRLLSTVPSWLLVWMVRVRSSGVRISSTVAHSPASGPLPSISAWRDALASALVIGVPSANVTSLRSTNCQVSGSGLVQLSASFGAILPSSRTTRVSKTSWTTVRVGWSAEFAANGFSETTGVGLATRRVVAPSPPLPARSSVPKEQAVSPSTPARASAASRVVGDLMSSHFADG